MTANGANDRNSTLPVNSTIGWALMAASRPAGANQTVSFTVYPIGGSPSHADASGTQSDAVAGDEIVLGSIQNGDFLDGWVAVVAIWDTNLSTAQRESLVTSMTRANWLSLSPDFLTDELDAFATDYAGTSTQSSLTGTTDDADDPTGWASWASDPPQTVRPDADIVTTGWATAPLWSKIEETSPDGTVITATAA
jgi:hypothetical protein